LRGLAPDKEKERSPRPIISSSEYNRGVNAQWRDRFQLAKEAGAKERFMKPQFLQLPVSRHSLSAVPARTCTKKFDRAYQ
jgi:hypothetical protein